LLGHLFFIRVNLDDPLWLPRRLDGFGRLFFAIIRFDLRLFRTGTFLAGIAL
jgi:hypothetical protein